MSGSVRPFSRLQSTHKPSPSGEGISLCCLVDSLTVVRHTHDDLAVGAAVAGAQLARV